MLEIVAFNVTVLAAVIYIIAEALGWRKWMRDRRAPPPEPEEPLVYEERVGVTECGPPTSRRIEPRPMIDTWPDDKIAEAEERWERMLRPGEEIHDESGEGS